MHRSFLILAFICCIFAGCMPAPYFQSQYPVPGDAWSYSFKPTFTFDITDTTVNYQPYFIIRHTQAYPYNNIWMWVYVKSPGDSIARKLRVNVVLAEQGGKWLGRGMGEIYEQRMRVSLSDSFNFSKKGTYKLSLEQNMRINPLPEVLNVGFRLEKGTLRR